MGMHVIEVDGNELRGRCPQGGPRQCYIEIDLDWNLLRARRSSGFPGTVPPGVLEGRVRRYEILPLTAAAANSLLADLLPLAERVAAGYVPPLRGLRQGHLNADGLAAESEIEAQIAERWRFWGAEDILGEWDGAADAQDLPGAAKRNGDGWAPAPGSTANDEIQDGFRESAIRHRNQLAAEAAGSLPAGRVLGGPTPRLETAQRPSRPGASITL